MSANVAVKRESVGGRGGARTDEWRTLSYVLGDGSANNVCLWADHCADPKEALAGALSVLRLAPEEVGDVVYALNVYMMSADMDAYTRAAQEEPFT